MWIIGALFLSYAKMYLWRIYPFLVWVAAPMVTGAIISYFIHDDAWQEQNVTQWFPPDRFLELLPNIVYDTHTGLQWIADPSQIPGIWGTPGAPEPMSWETAVGVCNDLKYGGFDDWRMPNEKELNSLTKFDVDHPAIDSKTFKNLGSDDYFSSSITRYGCENYFQTDPATGKKSWDQDRNKKKYCRPVRGKPTPYWDANLNNRLSPAGESRRRGK